jgi:hypothetical protein
VQNKLVTSAFLKNKLKDFSRNHTPPSTMVRINSLGIAPNKMGKFTVFEIV